jgi:hypothetical protein
MGESIENEIERVGKEIDRLRETGDPEGRIADLNSYLRVLYTKLAVELQKNPGRWGQDR